MNPAISVIICTYNRANILKECVTSIVNQSIPNEEYKIIIVDNNSTDNTKEIVNAFTQKHSNISYVFETKQGLSHARNRGAKEAQTEWIAYLDDDGLAHFDFIENALFVINKYNFDCFGGTYYPWYKYGKPKWLNPDFGRKELISDNITGIDSPILDGGIFAIKKQVLADCGYFSTELGMKGNKIAYGEETHLQTILLQKNYKLGYCPFWKMDHLVAKYKLSVLWHLKAEYAKGRDTMRLTGTVPVKWNILDKTKFIIHTLIKKTPKATRKLFNDRNYYIQNLILDIFSSVFFRWGQQSMK